jgi:hypothetical protein
VSGIIAPQPKDDYKYIEPIGLYAETLANCTNVLANDAVVDELVFDIDITGAVAATIELMYQIPADFKAFAGQADDLSLRFIQDGDSGDGVGDVGLSVNVLDTLGVDCDDDSIAAIAGTGAYVTLDCAMDAGTFVVGDYFIVQIIIAEIVGSEAGDACRITIPKLKYIPQ